MDQPIYMLNALWFKKAGGREKYLEYSAAVAPLLEKVGGEPAPAYKPEKALIGEFNPDVFFVVKYPSVAAFESMVTSEEYQAIRHLREEAIDNSLLIRCGKYDWS